MCQNDDSEDSDLQAPATKHQTPRDDICDASKRINHSGNLVVTKNLITTEIYSATMFV